MVLNNQNNTMYLAISKHIPMMEAFHVLLLENNSQPTSQFLNTLENWHLISGVKTISASISIDITLF